MKKYLLTIALSLVTLPAAAHDGHATVAGFAAGLAHPFIGADHLVAMLGIGLWSRRQEQPLALPAVFIAMMAAGALWQGGEVVAQGWILASVAAVCMLLAARIPAWSALLAVGLFGGLHGQVHGHELPGLFSAAGYLSASAALLGAGMAAGSLGTWPRPLVNWDRARA